MKKILGVVGVFVLLASYIYTPTVNAAGGVVWHETQQTTSSFNKNWPNQQIVGSEIYYAWVEDNGSSYSVWTAVSDLDGSNFVATQRRSSSNFIGRLDFEVSGSKMYLVWDENASAERIWTASMDTDGSNWSATQQASLGSRNQWPNLDVDGTKIYYVYIVDDEIATAEMNTDGTGWSATIRTSTSNVYRYPRLEVNSSKIYYVWYGESPTVDQIWTGSMNTNGTSWSTTQRTNTTVYNYWPSFKIDGTKMYIVWSEEDPSHTVIHRNTLMMAELNLDGTGWSETRLWENPDNFPAWWNTFPEINIDSNLVYVTWFGIDNNSNYILYTASVNEDGTDFIQTPRKVGTNVIFSFSVDILGSKEYYSWTEHDGSYYQLHTAYADNTDESQELQTVTATVPSNMVFTVDGVSAGNACANSGGNADITTTGSTVPFGIYTGSQTKIGCHTLTVSTNATNGYVVTVEQDQDLTSASSDTINPFSGTYATPTTWTSPPGSGTDAYFGYTTDDTDLSNFQTSKYGNFLANDTPYQIVTESGPVSNEANVMSYQLETNALQEAGTYTNTLRYICTPTF